MKLHERYVCGLSWIGSATIALLVIVSNLHASETQPAKSPHVVIVLVDDMGYGDPQCFNAQSKIETPAIDSLARDGMRFTDAHAPGPLCHLSRYGLLTGRYPFRTNVAAWPRKAVIAAELPTLGSVLQDAGYKTAMVGKWHLGFDEQGYDQPLPGGPVDRGFDSFFGIRASTDIPPYFYIRGDRAVTPPTQTIEANGTEGWSPIQGEFWRAGGIAPDLDLADVLPRFADEAVQVIEGHASKQDDQPLFLYVAFPAPHTPWLPSEEFAGKSQVPLYGDFVMMVDAMVGRITESLENTGMAKDTLLVFTSDNGPTWYPQDVEKYGHDSAGGLRGMKADAWEAGHRVPFIVRWPGVVSPGTTSDQLVCFTDLMATLSDALQRPLPENGGEDSVSFLHALLQTTPQQPPRSELVMQSGSGLFVIRQGDWKLIDGLGSGGFTKPSRIKPGPNDPAGQLFNLETDPAESENQYASQPEQVRRLTERLREVQAAAEADKAEDSRR